VQLCNKVGVASMKPKPEMRLCLCVDIVFVVIANLLWSNISDCFQ
jgi:hypothetical protein